MRSKVGPPPPGATRELGVAAMYILSPPYTPAGNECQNLSPVLDLSFRESVSPEARWIALVAGPMQGVPDRWDLGQ